MDAYRAGRTAVVFMLTLWVAVTALVPATHAEERIGDHPTGAPFRVRDLTFPNFLLLGFMPRPAASLGRGGWAAEVHYSVVNDFQVSDAIERYLEESRADGVRRPLDATDLAFIDTLPTEDAFYVDGEFGLLNTVINYGITDRLDFSVELNYLNYSGGDLDSGIESFHNEFGFSQQGRDFVPKDNFQVIIGGSNGALLQRPSAGGIGDPIFRLNYAIPHSLAGWRFNVGGGLKFPIASERDFLSTGSIDVGMTFSADRRWNRWGLILQANAIGVGDFDQRRDFDPPRILPSFDLVLLKSVGHRRKTTLLLQLETGENVFSELGASELTELAIQITAGMKYHTDIGVWGFALTENLFNMDSTVDVGYHLSWGRIFAAPE